MRRITQQVLNIISGVNIPGDMRGDMRGINSNLVELNMLLYLEDKWLKNSYL